MTPSSSRAGQGPDLAFDDDATGESFWSSGDDPPGWIEVGFDEPRTVGGVRMTVFQNPPSATLHVLELVIEGNYVEVARFEGFTQTGEVLVWTADTPSEQVEGVRVTTLDSLSWPEWYEIEVLP